MKDKQIKKGPGNHPTTTKSFWSMWTGTKLTDGDVLEIQQSIREYSELIAEWKQGDQTHEGGHKMDRKDPK